MGEDVLLGFGSFLVPMDAAPGGFFSDMFILFTLHIGAAMAAQEEVERMKEEGGGRLDAHRREYTKANTWWHS